MALGYPYRTGTVQQRNISHKLIIKGIVDTGSLFFAAGAVWPDHE